LQLQIIEKLSHLHKYTKKYTQQIKKKTDDEPLKRLKYISIGLSSNILAGLAYPEIHYYILQYQKQKTPSGDLRKVITTHLNDIQTIYPILEKFSEYIEHDKHEAIATSYDQLKSLNKIEQNIGKLRAYYNSNSVNHQVAPGSPKLKYYYQKKWRWSSLKKNDAIQIFLSLYLFTSLSTHISRFILSRCSPVSNEQIIHENNIKESFNEMIKNTGNQDFLRYSAKIKNPLEYSNKDMLKIVIGLFVFILPYCSLAYNTISGTYDSSNHTKNLVWCASIFFINAFIEYFDETIFSKWEHAVLFHVGCISLFVPFILPHFWNEYNKCYTQYEKDIPLWDTAKTLDKKNIVML
jgi:hypothetical protein